MEHIRMKPGPAKCLRCSKIFESKDVCTNRICSQCKKLNKREYLPRTASSSVYSSEGCSVGRIEADD